METKMVPRRPVTTVTSENSQEKLKKGVNILSNAVKSTLGVSGKTVIIEDMGGNPHATKDGVTVAKSIYLKDTVENMGAMIVRQAAINTGEEAGDGTTTSTVLAQEIINSKIPKNTPFAELKRGMEGAVEDVNRVLDNNTRRLLKKDIINVATISTNNDTAMGKHISDAFDKAGKHGMVIMDESPSTETYIEMTEGMEIGRGYASQHFINERRKGKVIMNNPLILICETKVDILSQIDVALGTAVHNKRPLLVIGDVSEDVLQALVINKLEGNINVCVINTPSYGFRRTETLEDLAVATGCTVISDDTGDNFEQIKPESLGEVESVIINSSKTILMLKDTVEVKDKVKTQVDFLKNLKKNSKKELKGWVTERIANLSSSVAIVKVGGHTEIERKEKKDRVDDAIHAVQAAIESGTVVGGGVALLRCGTLITPQSDSNIYNVGYEIVRSALKSPFRQILVNAGVEKESGYSGLIDTGVLSVDDFDVGYNIKTGDVCDLREIGILDPVKVVKTALSNAVSAAYNILSTENVVTYGG